MPLNQAAEPERSSLNELKTCHPGCQPTGELHSSPQVESNRAPSAQPITGVRHSQLAEDTPPCSSECQGEVVNLGQLMGVCTQCSTRKFPGCGLQNQHTWTTSD